MIAKAEGTMAGSMAQADDGQAAGPSGAGAGTGDQVITSLAQIPHAKRLVIKIGSALLVEGGAIRDGWIASLVDELSQLRSNGTEVLIVSSGAIALGASRLDLPQGGRASLADAQAAASVGQVELARLWASEFGRRNITAGQILLTLEDLEDRRRYLNAATTLGRLLEAGAVPVINENDSVATEEIRFGDNDRLASRVAQAIKADAIVLLSDVDGLFDGPPQAEGSQLIPIVDGLDDKIMAMAQPGSGSSMGSGGMASKLLAARIAERAGITLAIINGTCPAPLSRAIADDLGTLFLPQRRDPARKAWLGGRMAPLGTLRVDKGCEAALRNGASLLAAGIVGVSGNFARGDLVRIDAIAGGTIAQGLAEYAAGEIQAIAGKRAEDQREALGYAPRSTVVHRDQMVLL